MERDFSAIIKQAVSRLAPRVPYQERQDLEQEAALALYTAQARIGKSSNPERLAAIIVRKAISAAMRGLPPKAEDVSDLDVIRKYDKQSSQIPDCDMLIDSAKVVKTAQKLPEPYRFLILASFGVGGIPELTASELADFFNTSEDWVNRNTKQALQRLRTLMKVGE